VFKQKKMAKSGFLSLKTAFLALKQLSWTFKTLYKKPFYDLTKWSRLGTLLGRSGNVLLEFGS